MRAGYPYSMRGNHKTALRSSVIIHSRNALTERSDMASIAAPYSLVPGADTNLNLRGAGCRALM